MKKSEKEFHSGFAQTLIRRLFESTPDFFAGMGMLVTCIDSNHAPADSAALLQEIRGQGVQPDVIGKFIWVAPELVRKFLIESHALTGFDEIYLMRDRPTNDYVPRGIPTVATKLFTADPPVEVIENMNQVGAARYASDGIGIGLNYVCDSETLKRRLDSLGNDLPR